MSRFGGCCDCQQTVELRRATLGELLALTKALGYDLIDDMVDDLGEVSRFVCCDHDAFGTRCSGSGHVPQGICKEEDPMMERIGENQLAKVVEAAARKMGKPLNVGIGSAIDGHPSVITDEQGTIIAKGTPTECARHLVTFLRGYLYARRFSRVRAKFGWDPPEEAHNILLAAD